MVKLLVKLTCFMTYIIFCLSWIIVVNVLDFIVSFTAGLIIGYINEKNKQATLKQLNSEILALETDIDNLKQFQITSKKRVATIDNRLKEL